MSGNIEDDLFYDLFGDEGFLTPESSKSADQDSGHGSPFGSNFDASPQSFGWDTADHVGELWGSILDDLPSDITDDSDSNDYKSPLSSSNDNDQDDLCSWSTKIVDERAGFDCNSMDVDNNWGIHGNSLYDVENSNSTNVNNNNILYVTSDDKNISNSIVGSKEDNDAEPFPVCIPDPEGTKPDSELPSKPIDENNMIMKQSSSEVAFQSTPPILIKPGTMKKGPTWIVKTSDVKSQFQIGQNIVAIIQSVNNNNNASNSDEKTFSIESINTDLVENIKSCDSNSEENQEDAYSHIKHSDHDYADREIPQVKETMGVSKGLGPGLVLTDEEKKLLELESLKLPEDAPLTKEEEKILKKVRRKIKNKQSAMESRRKRKEYIENLERRVKHCTDLNHGLRKKVDKLTKENKSLVNQLKTMKEFIATSFNQTRTASTGTCLAVLLLSFALFVLPFNPFHYDGKYNSLPTDAPNPTPVFRSRTLLTVEDNAEYVYHDNELNLSNYSIHHDSHLINEPNMSVDNVKIHFGSFGNNFENEFLLSKTNISMLIYENSK